MTEISDVYCSNVCVSLSATVIPLYRFLFLREVNYLNDVFFNQKDDGEISFSCGKECGRLLICQNYGCPGVNQRCPNHNREQIEYCFMFSDLWYSYVMIS
jgi:hypothetical protein